MIIIPMKLIRVALLLFVLTIFVLVIVTVSTTASRLRVDQPLSDADASFTGEDDNDKAGYSVAAAGDVNGDGYDDFLIGAMYDEEEDPEAGQVYLIFGNASGWWMDINLSQADASFLGENDGDHAGASVAGAGDVNGDGFDDILIGAPENTGWNMYSGQAYLILGKASGWSMDTSLSNSDASFWGEGSYDHCGANVAGAGDVNDDGYDDFLIGASYNDESGINAGQTYLILGKKRGWSMDTRLQSVDASFLGENDYDYSGSPVAGVGDVNGDGIDDFIIGARVNSEGGNRAGQTYLILGKSSGWSMDIDLSNVNASFWGEASRDSAGLDLDGAGDVNGDGFDDFLIGSRNTEGGDYAGQVYLIFGKASGWSMDSNLSSSDASFLGATRDNLGMGLGGAGDVNNDGFDDILIGASGNDDGGTDAGKIYLILGKASGWSMDTNLSTAQASFLGEVASDYAGDRALGRAGDVNGDGYDDFLIGVTGNDEVGTYAGQTYLILSDYLSPSIESDETLSIAFTGDTSSFNITATDNCGVSNVSIEFWYGKSHTRSNISLNLTSGTIINGTWAGNITIPNNSTDALHYIVHIEDTASYLFSTEVKNISVLDNDEPTVLSDDSDGYGTTGEWFHARVNVTDNIGVSKVHMVYWLGDEPSPLNNRTMIDYVITGLDKGIYIADIYILFDDRGPINYYFALLDDSGLWNVSGQVTVPVLDNDPPMLRTEVSPNETTTGDLRRFQISAFDNWNISEVRCIYWFGTGLETNATMVLNQATNGDNGIYVLDALMPMDTIETMSYYFFAVDTSGNWNVTTTYTSPLGDNDPPEFTEDSTDRNGTTGDAVRFQMTVMDNVEIASANVVYWFESDVLTKYNVSMIPFGPIVLDRVTFYMDNLTLEMDSLDSVLYFYEFSDTSGNWNRTSFVHVVNVTDNDPPLLVTDLTPDEGLEGHDLIFTAILWDNIAIDQVYLEYWYVYGSLERRSNVSMTRNGNWSTTFEIYRFLESDLTYFISFSDVAGNWNATTKRVVTITNLPPVIGEIPVWEVVEGRNI
jgi:hypothetical protein